MLKLFLMGLGLFPRTNMLHASAITDRAFSPFARLFFFLTREQSEVRSRKNNNELIMSFFVGKFRELFPDFILHQFFIQIFIHNQV